MYRILAGCVFMGLAMAQTDPIADAVQAVQDGRSRGNFVEAAAGREAARKLLEQVPASADRYFEWVGSVAALYSSAGRMVEAEAMVSRAFDIDSRQRELMLPVTPSTQEATAFRRLIMFPRHASPVKEAVPQVLDPRQRESFS